MIEASRARMAATLREFADALEMATEYRGGSVAVIPSPDGTSKLIVDLQLRLRPPDAQPGTNTP